MKYIIAIIIVLFLLSLINCHADQLKPDGKWIPRSEYVFKPSHKVPLYVARKWVENENICTLRDFEFSIIEVDKNYEVFINYIMNYSEKNEPLFTVGGHVALMVSKKGEIIQIFYGE